MAERLQANENISSSYETTSSSPIDTKKFENIQKKSEASKKAESLQKINDTNDAEKLLTQLAYGGSISADTSDSLKETVDKEKRGAQEFLNTFLTTILYKNANTGEFFKENEVPKVLDVASYDDFVVINMSTMPSDSAGSLHGTVIPIPDEVSPDFTQEQKNVIEKMLKGTKKITFEKTFNYGMRPPKPVNNIVLRK